VLLEIKSKVTNAIEKHGHGELLNIASAIDNTGKGPFLLPADIYTSGYWPSVWRIRNHAQQVPARAM